MSRGGYFFKTAVDHLHRGGQRTVVALMCVTFGVMSLVAMTTLSKSIQQMWKLEPYERIGGDLTLGRMEEENVSVEAEAGLKQMNADGEISGYSMMAYSSTLSFHRPDSGELFFPSVGMGVDPGTYPLAGNLRIAEPKGKYLSDLIANTGDVVITRDLALNYRLRVGDPIVLSDLSLGKPLAAVVRGIAADTPNHQGSKVYYSQASANLLSGLERSANTVLVNSSNPDSAGEKLNKKGWHVFTARELADMANASESAMAMGLNDLGLMGVLVGGIGIANTMQVLLRRRRREVAVWKTLGYSGRTILGMFVLEAALLGVTGSLIGAGLGVVLSYGLVDMFSKTTTYLVQWAFFPAEVITGVVVGVLITVIFAMWAIVSTSRVRPLALLRNEALQANKLPFVQSIGLGLMLLVPFMAIAAWILKSLWVGLIVLTATLIGLGLLGLGLWWLVWLVLKIIPMNAIPLGRISRNNLRQRGASLIFAMVALFIGVSSLGMGAVIVESGKNVMGMVQGKQAGENLAIYAAPADSQTIEQELKINGIKDYSSSRMFKVQDVRRSGESDIHYSDLLMARSDLGSFEVTGSEWGSRLDGVYVREYINLPVGSRMIVTDLGGTKHTLEVVGTYQYQDQASWPGATSYFLVPESTASQLGQPESIQYYLEVTPEREKNMAARFGKALPQTTIISMADYQASNVRMYQNLFVFAAAMAGMAILAGVLLVANSVSLSTLDRRYEIGILKSIGYSRGQVLFTQVVEYTLMAVIITLTALGMIWGFLGVMSLVEDMLGSLLMLPLSTAGGIAAFSVGLILAVVLWVTWRPTSISPAFVLNDRE